jgi:hypothetical protein
LQGRDLAAAAEGSESPAQETLVGGERVGAGDGDEQAADDEREED